MILTPSAIPEIEFGQTIPLVHRQVQLSVWHCIFFHIILSKTIFAQNHLTSAANDQLKKKILSELLSHWIFCLEQGVLIPDTISIQLKINKGGTILHCCQTIKMVEALSFHHDASSSHGPECKRS